MDGNADAPMALACPGHRGNNGGGQQEGGSENFC